MVFWGAYVRATGSGAGCGNHWPLCNGEVTPHSPSLQTVIEFTHRASSGVDLLLVGVLVYWAFRAFPHRHPVRRGAVLSAVFLVTEALLGASLVLLHHVADNASVSRVYSLSLHLANTLTLLACLALTAWWAGGHPPVRLRGRALWIAAATLLTVVAAGITGAIAALGDTLFPAPSLAAGLARDFDPASNADSPPARLASRAGNFGRRLRAAVRHRADGWKSAVEEAGLRCGAGGGGAGWRGGAEPGAAGAGLDADGPPAAGGCAVDRAGAAVCLAPERLTGPAQPARRRSLLHQRLMQHALDVGLVGQSRFSPLAGAPDRGPLRHPDGDVPGSALPARQP